MTLFATMQGLQLQLLLFVHRFRQGGMREIVVYEAWTHLDLPLPPDEEPLNLVNR